MSTLAGLLEQRFQIPIVDKTGLAQAYDYSLAWIMAHPVVGDNGELQGGLQLPDLETVKQALLGQLGLELVATNMPIEMLVVEKAK